MLVDIQWNGQRKTIPIKQDVVTVGGDQNDTVFLDKLSLPKALFVIEARPDHSVFLKAKNGTYYNGQRFKAGGMKIGDSFIFCRGNQEIVRITARKELPVKPISLPRELTIGKKDTCLLRVCDDKVSRLHATLTFRDSVAEITDMNSTNGTFVNEVRIKRQVLRNNDVISIAGYKFLYRDGSLLFETNPQVEYLGDSLPVHSEHYPVIYPSPKLAQAVKYERLDIQPPPNIGAKPEANWFSLIVQPLITGGIMAAIFLIIPMITNVSYSPFMMLFSLPMMLISAISGLINHKKQNEKYRERFGKKIEKYGAYIKKIDHELSLSVGNQLHIALESNPPTEKCLEIVTGEGKELWNRTILDPDFLSFRIGTGAVENAVPIKVPNNEMDLEEDKLLAKIKKVVDQYRVIPNMPLLVDLKRHPVVGVYGSDRENLSLVQNFIQQLATFHTYNDLHIVLLTTEQKYEQLSWIRWLPHAFSYDRNSRYIALTNADVKNVLKTVMNDMRGRVVKESESAGGKFESLMPFYLFVITEPQYITNPELQPLFPPFGCGNGSGAILTVDYFEQLPGNTSAFIQASNSGCFFYEKGSAKERQPFAPDFVSDAAGEAFGRAIAPLRVIDSENTKLLPSSVSFFEGMRITHPQDWPLQRYWSTANYVESMSVPIGTGENGEVFRFDINEKKDGPHGIVAGRSGSGKSELLQDWILSMAMHFSPTDVSFVLIDPKKAITQLLKTLPHVAGTIEEIENSHLINKCFHALNAEIGRRQELFKRAGVQSIFKYNEKRAGNPSLERLSILFVVIDEYAEFKRLYPEIAKENIDAVLRIGRSLGVYAILATQNPSGIVTDSMEANVKFRWCLPVAEESYSVEMLGSGHTEAAYLKNPGRVYVKIGSDEFYLVQSFFTGARFNPDADKKRVVKMPVAIVKPDGTRERSLENNKTIGARNYQTEAELMVEYLHEYTRKNKIPFARQIWTPLMPPQVFLPDLLKRSFDGSAWPKSDGSLSAVIGLVDNPFLQSQYPLRLDFSGEGHHFIHGAPMSGKTTFLQTVIMSLCLLYSPEEVNIYGLDFGSWTLGMFRDYPQIGGIANSNEEEKIHKLIILMQEMLKERRELFSSVGVGNLKVYREVTQKVIPYVVLVVDNLQKVIAYNPDLADFFQTLVSEGANYGIFLVATLTGLSGVSYKITDQVKRKIALQMNDESEYAAILGLKSFALRPLSTAGRGLVEVNKAPMEYQTALPVKSESESDRIKEIRNVGIVMGNAWHGELPRPIPIMPDVIRYGSIRSDGITLGLRVRDVKPLVFKPSASHFLLISGTPGSGKTNLLRVAGAQFKEHYSAKVIGMNTQEAHIDDSLYDEYLTSADEIDNYFEELSAELKRRKDAQLHNEPPADCVVLLIDNFRRFYECISDSAAKRLEALIKLGKGLNVFCVIADDASSFAKEFGRTEPFTTIGNGRYRILLGGNYNMHASFDTDLTYSEKSELLNEWEGFYMDGKTTVKFKGMKGA